MTQKEIALKIIKKAFDGKVDKAGQPYINHLTRVAKKAENMNIAISDDLEIVALLHDLLENCPEWNKESLSVFFYSEIIEAVDCLTKRPSQTYEQYISQVLTNRYATIIKKFDLIDNMDITRLDEIADEDIERLKKYHTVYKRLL